MSMIFCLFQDWLSFGKQKQIAQFWFETVPQVSIQTLLFFGIVNGKEVSGITDSDLVMSVIVAAANSLFSVFELFAESRGVGESFVQYSLHCITARHGWVPFTDTINRFLGGNYEGQEVRRKTLWNQLFGLKAIPNGDDVDGNETEKSIDNAGGVATTERAVSNTLHIDYDMKYRLPLLSYITNEKVTSSIVYSFSRMTLRSLMALFETKRGAFDAKSPSGSTPTSPRRSSTIRTKSLSIKFRKSLDLLSVRQIVELMQCCRSQGIILPDIHEVDWPQIFKNTSIEEDPRLYSNTFDEHNRPLLISIYLTKYDNNDWQILRDLIALDADINVTDNEGSTLLHHMLKEKDWKTIDEVLFSGLRSHHRINFNLENDEGKVIILEMIKMPDEGPVEVLKEVFNVLKPRQKIDFAVSDRAGDSIFHHLVRRNDADVLQNVIGMIQSHYNDGDKLILSISNNNDESVIALALDFDAKRLTEVDQELVLDLPDIEQEDEKDDDDDSDIDEEDEDEDDKASDKGPFGDQWMEFVKFWLQIQEKSDGLDPVVLVNVLYLKASQLIHSLPQRIDSKERMNRIKWLNYRIRDILKKSKMLATFTMEISAERRASPKYEEARNREILNGFKKQYGIDNLEGNMMHRVLLQYENILLYNHRYPQKSVLGFVLKNYMKYYEYFDIVDWLLKHEKKRKSDAMMIHEIPIFVDLYGDAAAKTYSSPYFALLDKVWSVLL